MRRCFGLMLGIVLAVALLLACGGKPNTGSGLQEGAFGPYPVDFRDVVQGHVAKTYPRGQVLRNVIVRPPSAGWMTHEGQRLAGHVGQVDFSLRDQERQTFRRVTYCYFLHDGAVLFFEDQEQAAWCTQSSNQQEVK